MHESDPKPARTGATHLIDPDLAEELAAQMQAEGIEIDRLRVPRPLEPLEPVDPRRPLQPANPIWWRCARRGPVSGRYEGGRSGPGRVDYELDLRVDIDPRGANSPVMDRVSGDVYRVHELKWMHRTFRWRVYQRSWIVDAPTVTWSRCSVRVTGDVTFWDGGQPATELDLTIPWGTFRPAGPATARLISGVGTTTYVCRRESDNFRDVTLEIDVADSVDAGTVLPTYDSHAHDDRPAGLAQRDLDIVACFREAGLGIALNHPSTVIDDSDASFTTWSPAELHDAMEGAFSQIGGGWPKWHMWGLMCGDYQSSSTAGIMFDAASTYGGAGDAPERQGFAVFRNHAWFDELPNGAPANQAQAWALRQFLYTWVHEAGHAFNFVHSWNKSRPDALSWMNYPQRVTDFWDDFEFRFDDEELIHLRHGNRAAVIMGGDAWATGLHLHDEANLGVAEGSPPLELIVRSKGYFEFMEPVSVELRLRNLVPDMEMPIDARLDPRWGTVSIQIMKPGGGVGSFDPVFCEIGDPELHTLKPAGSTPGLDRFSYEVPLAFGRTGFVFAEPGEYRVRAVYDMGGLGTIPSPVHVLRVGLPASRDEDRMAQDVFSFDAGLCLVLDGSRSAYLDRGRAKLEELAHRAGSTMAGAKAAIALAKGLQRPFFTVDRAAGKLTKSGDAQPDAALKLTETAVRQVRGEPRMNIAYNMLVRQRAAVLAEVGQAGEAKREVEAMRQDLAQRGVNEPVLKDIDAFAGSLA